MRKIDELVRQLESISEDTCIVKLKIIERTKSILKARLFFSEDVFIQIYVNIKRPKESYALIINDVRIFGKDYLFGRWHIHPFGSPDIHDVSEASKYNIDIEDFADEAISILSEKLRKSKQSSAFSRYSILDIRCTTFRV